MASKKPKKRKKVTRPEPGSAGLFRTPEQIAKEQDESYEPEEQLGTREASFVIDENTVLYYFNYIGEVCMGHCIKALMDPELGEEMAWIYLANVNDNYNTETDVDPVNGTIGPFEIVRKSSEVYLYDPTTEMEDFMPTEWWKFATGDIVAGEGG